MSRTRRQRVRRAAGTGTERAARAVRVARAAPVGWRRGALVGAAAGAAGTTALDAVTYLDMALRGRPSNSTPEDMVEKISERAHVQVPGNKDVRGNRIEGLAPLSGILAGIGTGILLGAARGLGWRPPLAIAALAATAGALVGANGPMAALGITDPRSWSTEEWAADAVPHLAYGVVTAWVLDAVDARP